MFAISENVQYYPICYNIDMATLKDFRDERLRKLGELREMGMDPYPARSERNIEIAQILRDFEAYDGREVVVAGRVMGIRSFGKLAFVVIDDATAKVQLFLKGEVAGFTRLLDTGDFVEAQGKVGKSQTGEISVFADEVRVLSKALRPLPGRDGFTNKEERLRRRYVDMAVNPEVRERFVRRAKFWTATREFLNQHGFIEINTPVLEQTTGGADATPFTTHMDALDEDFYLRISQELPLKRLIGGGFNRVYDIGPRFRNEGMSDEHLPEHIAMESYAAYQDYREGMKFYEEMIKFVARETWGRLQFERDGMKVDLDGEWPVISYADIMREKFGVDVFAPDVEQLKGILREHKVPFDDSMGAGRLLDNVWKIIRRESAGPFWLIHEPVEVSPLAKRSVEDPRVTERFHPIILGTEMGNGYSELNDPLDQLARFQEQQALRDAGDDEAQMLDMDFVEMLEYGMPPTCGWGNSERNFWLLEGVSAREGVPFPPMRREEQ